jgi:hypothetical protein
MGLKGVRGLHYEGVEIEPPEPGKTLAGRKNSFSVFRVTPFSIWIFPHAVPDDVDFLPTFPPLMSVALLCAHICDLQIVTPSFRVLLLVLNAVSFDRPFTGPFPIHHTTPLICSQYDYKLASATKMGISAVFRLNFYTFSLVFPLGTTISE